MGWRHEHRTVALADRQRAAKLLSASGPEDHADDHRRHGNVVAPHEEADEADHYSSNRSNHELRRPYAPSVAKIRMPA